MKSLSRVLLSASLFLLPLAALAQDAPTPQPDAAAAPATQAQPFAKPDPRNFTADKPTPEEVNAFLRATWGYDPNLEWQTEAIAKTAVPGVTKVTVAIGQKSNAAQRGALVFYAMPDGTHIISSDEIVPFGAHPFAAYRKVLQEKAAGPAHGSASKDLMLVEFADFQCPHCKEAQPTVQRLLTDFPNARFVFENFPLPQHSEAFKAAAYGVCVQKAAGDDAFFKFADDVFTNQASLTPEASDQTLKAAVTKAGLDPAKIAACSTSPEAAAAIQASVALTNDLQVHETPTLFVNGRGLPLGGIQYDQLKSIISFQAAEDGVSAAAAPVAKP